jgi:GTP cyclohydrolase I
MQGAVRTLLECIGEDPDRDGLLDTPSRYSKALLFLTKGYHANLKDIVNNALFHEGHNDMVIVKDIDISSLCEHHLVPFTGKMHIGYIPSNTVIGLSKLPRVAEIFARRLQIQERLTKQVAHAIMEIIKPQGVAVVMESNHLCMAMRGVEKASAMTLTSCMLGCFERKSRTRKEFMDSVGMNR